MSMCPNNRFATLGVVLLLVFAVAPVTAQQIGPRDLDPTPSDLWLEWTDALHQYLTTNPGLTSAEHELVMNALRAVGPEAFAEGADPAVREKLARSVLDLQVGLPCGGFAELLTDHEGLRTWMLEEEVITTDTCTCNGHDDCAGTSQCVATRCISEKNSLNNGTCS